MKKLIKRFIVFLSSSFSAIILLSLFCYIYSYTGIHVYNDSNATDYKWQKGQYKANMTEGFAWIRFDDNGFNNIDSNTNNIDMLIMGSSHMEAVQIKQKDNVSEIINKNTNYKVYNIGMSGHQIYNIVNNFESAINYYNPNKYVIIEVDNIDLDVNTMNDVINKKFARIKSYDSGVVFYAQKIPAVKTIYKQVQDWLNTENNTESNVEKLVLNNIDEYDKTLYNFLKIINENSKKNNIKTIIVYHPREKLDKNGDINYITDVSKLNSFKDDCEKLDIIFIDMSETFKKYYYKEHKLAHGFNNTHVGNGHLNKFGHKLIANELIYKINEMEAE